MLWLYIATLYLGLKPIIICTNLKGLCQQLELAESCKYGWKGVGKDIRRQLFNKLLTFLMSFMPNPFEFFASVFSVDSKGVSAF
jgi:hypothetical protein